MTRKHVAVWVSAAAGAAAVAIAVGLVVFSGAEAEKKSDTPSLPLIKSRIALPYVRNFFSLKPFIARSSSLFRGFTFAMPLIASFDKTRKSSTPSF